MGNARFGAAFVDRICAETLDSAAVNHPYLRAMRLGDFPDVHFAFKDFAFQYGLYTFRFVRYLSAVIDRLKRPEHKQVLLSNMAEENGQVYEIGLPPAVLSSVSGQSHANLYRRFQKALGIDVDGKATEDNGRNGLRWRQQFQELCETNECVGIGALGIGTELIVSRVYKQILDGLETHSELTREQRVFFELHSHCDGEHAAQMISIAEDLAVDRETSEQLEHGVCRALELRTEFWDQMLERAQSFPTASSLTLGTALDIGYQKSL